jgi:hypothetical protein
MVMRQVEPDVEFTLPRGYADAGGRLHREGVMRLATAADEILPLRDPRVRAIPEYVTVIVLSRVITRLGTLELVDPDVIESLGVADLAYLKRLYERLNNGAEGVDVECPHCGEHFEADVDHPGESLAVSPPRSTSR